MLSSGRCCWFTTLRTVAWYLRPGNDMTLSRSSVGYSQYTIHRTILDIIGTEPWLQNILSIVEAGNIISGVVLRKFPSELPDGLRTRDPEWPLCRLLQAILSESLFSCSPIDSIHLLSRGFTSRGLS